MKSRNSVLKEVCEFVKTGSPNVIPYPDLLYKGIGRLEGENKGDKKTWSFPLVVDGDAEEPVKIEVLGVKSVADVTDFYDHNYYSQIVLSKEPSTMYLYLTSFCTFKSIRISESLACMSPTVETILGAVERNHDKLYTVIFNEIKNLMIPKAVSSG